QSGCAEKRAIEHRALVPDLDVALPGEADSSVHLDSVACDLHEAVGEMCLGKRGVVLRFGRKMIEGMGRVPVETPCGLDLHRHVCELMLHRLEMADRDSELNARLRVLDRELDTARSAAKGIGGQEDEAGIADARLGFVATGQKVCDR